MIQVLCYVLSTIPIINFQKKSPKISIKETLDVFLLAQLFLFSKANLTINFISPLNVTLALIGSKVYTSQDNICWNMTFHLKKFLQIFFLENYNSKGFWAYFKSSKTTSLFLSSQSTSVGSLNAKVLLLHLKGFHFCLHIITYVQLIFLCDGT